MGPKTTPIADTATAFSMREGTLQIVTSSLEGGYQLPEGSVRDRLRDREHCVDKHDATFANLVLW